MKVGKSKMTPGFWLEIWVVRGLFPESAKARSKRAQFHSFIYCNLNVY